LRLSSDRISPSKITDGLHPLSFIREVLYYQKTESTNVIAKNLATEGTEEGTVIITDEQLKGRGRLDRTWLSPSGKNILMSVIFRPELEVSKVFSLTMLASLAVAKAVKKTTGLDVHIKWPNDIYRKNKKIGGILTEFNADHGNVTFVIVGIGLNVNCNPLLYPEIKDSATSISVSLGRKVSRVKLVQSILGHIDETYRMLKNGKRREIYKEWIGYSLVIGRRVTIISSEVIDEGVVDCIHEDGRLVLKRDNGETIEVLNGDVSLRLAH